MIDITSSINIWRKNIIWVRWYSFLERIIEIFVCFYEGACSVGFGDRWRMVVLEMIGRVINVCCEVYHWDLFSEWWILVISHQLESLVGVDIWGRRGTNNKWNRLFTFFISESRLFLINILVVLLDS